MRPRLYCGLGLARGSGNTPPKDPRSSRLAVVYASKGFSLVSHIRASLKDTIFTLLNNVSAADMVFAKNEDSTFVYHLPVGVNLRIVFGTDHFRAPLKGYDVLVISLRKMWKIK